jgi:hypothetical protein
MSVIDESLVSLSDEAKMLAFWLFRTEVSPVPVLSSPDGFFGPVYEAALQELQAAGILEEAVERTPHIACYKVHRDLSSLVWWFVSQTSQHRDALVVSMKRRVPDDRPVAKLVRRLDSVISSIEFWRHSDQTDYKPLVDLVDDHLKDIRFDLIGTKSEPEIKKEKRFAVEAQWDLQDALKTSEIKKMLGGLKWVEGGDPDKCKIEWYFSVNGEKASIWDWKGAWAAFGPREVFEKLGFKQLAKW